MPKVFEGLVDARGRPIEKKTLTEDVAGPRIGGVRTPLTDYPGDGLTPQRLNAILKEADTGQPKRYFELAEQIEEKDLHYAAVLAVRKRSVTQIPITVTPASEDSLALEQAQMVEDWIERGTLDGELFDVLDAIGKGESFTEIMWDSSEGQFWPKALEHRPPQWFRPDRVDLATPRLIGDGGSDIELPGGKFIHLVARGKSGLPARSGLGRLASWFWLFKGLTTRDWAQFAATFGQPLRLGKYGPNASEADKNTLWRAVASIAGDCAAIIPQSMAIEFTSPPTSSTTDLFERRADWLDRQMSKAVLGQTTTTDAISGGHAVSQEHRQVQEDIERADARVLAAALNRDLVRVWIDLEYGPQEAYPRIEIARPDEEDLTALADQMSKMVPLGLRVSARELRSKWGLGEPEAGEEILGKPPAPATATAAPGAGTPDNADMTAGATGATGATGAPALQMDRGVLAGEGAAKRLEKIVADAQDLSAPAMDSLFDALAEIVDGASSLEELRRALREAMPEAPRAAIALAFRQAQVLARLSGREELLDA